MHWYDVAGRGVVEYGVPGAVNTQDVDNCLPWCQSRALDSCSIKNALLAGSEMRCGYDGVTRQCAVFAARNLQGAVVTTAVSEVKYASLSSCSVDLSNVTACPAPSPCVASNTSIALVEQMCRAADPPLNPGMFAECVFDCCAMGADPSCVAGTSEVQDTDDEIVKNRPPTAPPPPTPVVPVNNFFDFLDHCTPRSTLHPQHQNHFHAS